MPDWIRTRQERLLYCYLQQMGAPVFETPEEMAAWVRRNFKSQLVVINDILPILAMVQDVNSDVFQSILRFLRRIVTRLNSRRRNSFLEGIPTPLLLNPKSLHPNGPNTLSIMGV